MDYVYRPTFGRVLAAIVGVICLVAVVMTVVHDGWSGFRALPWVLLLAGACWAVFWRPEVRVDDGGVHLVNVLRTIDVPWPSIQVVDTKWALALVTSYGTYTAWAAPTSSRKAGQEISKGDLKAMPSSTFVGGRSIRPGDSPLAPSGQVAAVIRRHWEELRDAGHLDAPKDEFSRVPITWHRTTLVVAAVLLVLGGLTLLV